MNLGAREALSINLRTIKVLFLKLSSMFISLLVRAIVLPCSCSILFQGLLPVLILQCGFNCRLSFPQKVTNTKEKKSERPAFSENQWFSIVTSRRSSSRCPQLQLPSPSSIRSRDTFCVSWTLCVWARLPRTVRSKNRNKNKVFHFRVRVLSPIHVIKC